MGFKEQWLRIAEKRVQSQISNEVYQVLSEQAGNSTCSYEPFYLGFLQVYAPVLLIFDFPVFGFLWNMT